MLIDKSKFLVMMATISAASSGCILVTGDASTDGSGGNGGNGTSATTTTSTASTGTGNPGCLDDTGSAEACSSECEGVTNCGAVQYLHKGIAEDAVPCMNSLNPASCGLAVDVYENCLLTSLSKGCEYAAETQSICTTIAETDCGVTDTADWQTECQIRLDGLTPAGRTVVESCMASYCMSGTQLDDCMLSLFN
jgi:hypothetical protein